MHVSGDVTRPPIKVPKRPHVQGVPTATDQCSRAIIVIDKLELSAMQCEMAQKLGIMRLFHDLEGQETPRSYLGNSLLKSQTISENTFSRRPHERPLARRRKWTWQSYLIKPVIRGGVDRRKGNNVGPHCGGRSIDEKAILDNALLILSQFPFRQSRDQQHWDHAQIHRRRF